MIYRARRFLKHVLPRAIPPGFPLSTQPTFSAPELGDWYSPVLLSPSSIGARALSANCLRQVMQIIDRMESDNYVRYLQAYYQAGLDRFGDSWHYADIVTVLLAAAQLARPQSYLEIGVRRGRSMGIVAATCPDCNIVGFDLWQPDYAGIQNPGPDFVAAEMKTLGHRGRLELVSGNSHETLPKYFQKNPEAYFDLITVDGDHSAKGALQDLSTVVARLNIGGILVFDDICHPMHPYLYNVWQKVIRRQSVFTTWEFTELGYGVTLSIRREA